MNVNFFKRKERSFTSQAKLVPPKSTRCKTSLEEYYGGFLIKLQKYGKNFRQGGKYSL